MFSELKGNFILSTYPSDLLEKYEWNTIKIKGILVSVSLGRKKMKTAVLTGN